MNGDGLSPLDAPAKYLPSDVAGYLREHMAGLHLTDRGARGELITIVEMAFQRGHDEGYSRGYHDGVAERDLQFAELNRGVDVLDPRSPVAAAMTTTTTTAALLGGELR